MNSSIRTKPDNGGAKENASASGLRFLSASFARNHFPHDTNRCIARASVSEWLAEETAVVSGLVLGARPCSPHLPERTVNNVAHRAAPTILVTPNADVAGQRMVDGRAEYLRMVEPGMFGNGHRAVDMCFSTGLSWKKFWDGPCYEKSKSITRTESVTTTAQKILSFGLSSSRRGKEWKSSGTAKPAPVGMR